MYEVSSGVRSTRSEDGGIVLDIDHGQMFRLNLVGALILESLAKGSGEAEIARGLVLQYSIKQETAIADVREFLKSLEEHRVVRMHHDETSCTCR